MSVAIQSNNNKTGFKGITEAPNGRYYAKVMHQGRSITTGGHNTPEHAAIAYTACKNMSRALKGNI